MMSCDFVDKLLSKWFMKCGQTIGKYPGYFVLVPLFLSVIFATGLQRIHYEDDPEYLFSPVDGRSKHEKKTIDTLFPMNYSDNFNVGRITHKGRFGRILIVAKDGGSVMRESIFREIVHIDAIIRNMTIEYDDDSYNYEDVCARMNGRCHSNDILDFADKIKDIEAGQLPLQYPLWINRDLLKAYFFPAYLGGVTTLDNKTITASPPSTSSSSGSSPSHDDLHAVERAKAVSLMYFLDISVKRGDERAALWENKFISIIDSIPLENVSVAKFVSTTLRTELESNTTSLVPFFSITVIVMIIFSVATCMMADWVQSKPWLGLLGCVSAGLGVAASFGLCVYCGVDMIGINLAAPFLMLGVGMDDAFVLLAAWRRTNPSLSVSDRLGHTYAEAAVSISITSITNFISFIIGTITPFPSVRIFCTYTAVAVLFTYVWHITFFGGCMAFFGHAEKKNLHGLTCVPVMPKSKAVRERKSWLFVIMCTGGRDPADPDNPVDNQEHSVMVFFRDVVAEALNKPLIKLLVIFIFLIYLVIGIYGCTQVREGLDRRKLSRDDSYSVKYYDYEDRFFREYPYRIQVVINQTLNYADPAVQEKVDKILSRFESSQYVAESFLTESWLRSYLQFIKQEDSFLFLQSLNLTNQDDFYAGLRSIFLHLPMTESFRNDVVFSEDGTEIIASRFVIQTKNIKDANMEKEMLITLRSIADEFKSDHVSIFNHLFIFFDQFILVREISLQTITVAAVVMMAISLFFIPSPSCAIWVAFSIVSIEIGVIGYMTHWGVNLDSISMINLIMCIGFSVDFSAHISYAFISCEESSSKERVKSALYSLGLPIFQGSISTILGIVALAFAPSYVFLTFFKTVFLVMLFGATHGVLLLPVLLSLTDGCFRSNKSNNSELDVPISKAAAGKGSRKSHLHPNHRPNHSLHDHQHHHHHRLPLDHQGFDNHAYDVFALTAANTKKNGQVLHSIVPTNSIQQQLNSSNNYPFEEPSQQKSHNSPSSHSPSTANQSYHVNGKLHSSYHHHLQGLIRSSSQCPNAPTFSSFSSRSPYVFPEKQSLMMTPMSPSGDLLQEARENNTHSIFIPRVTLLEPQASPSSSSSDSPPSSFSSAQLHPNDNRSTSHNLKNHRSSLKSSYSSNWARADGDSGQGSKSTTSSDGELCQKDMGLGTSGEETIYSEGSNKSLDPNKESKNTIVVTTSFVDKKPTADTRKRSVKKQSGGKEVVVTQPVRKKRHHS